MKLKDLLELATSSTCLGWRVCDFPWALGEFLKYIIEKYNVDLNVEVGYDYREEEDLIYAIIPITAFKKKPPTAVLRKYEKYVEAVAKLISLFVPLGHRQELRPLFSAIAAAFLLPLPAGTFERKVVHNKKCRAKYLNAKNIVVVCR